MRPTRLYPLLLVAVAAAAHAAPVTTLELGRAEVEPVPGQDWHPLIDRELLRQSLLLAAREEFGLQTRDAVLGESADGNAAPVTLALVPHIAFDRETIRLGFTRGGDTQAIPVQAPPREAFMQDVPVAATQAEAMSRAQFVELLKQQGLTPRPAKSAPNGTVDVAAETSLAELDPLTQLAGLRVVHEQVRTQGESPARLAALARGYANLFQLTAFVWGGSPKAFAARALLYGERAVIKFPDSPDALDGRAYANAMVGLPARALADLDAAKAARGGADEAEPNGLLRNFAGMKFADLTNAGDKDGPYRPLACFLAFLSLEHSGATAVTLNAAQRALDVLPGNLRLLTAINHHSGPGRADAASFAAGRALAARIGALDTLPGLPANVGNLVKRLRGQEGAVGGRMKVAAALHTAAAADPGEPSWHCLARQIEDLSFMCVMQQAYDGAVRQGTGGGDVVDASAHLVDGHRYRAFLETLRRPRRHDDEQFNAALAEVVIDDPSYAMFQVWRFWQGSQIKTKTQARWEDLSNNGDTTAFDMGIRAESYHMGRALEPRDRQLQWIIEPLQRAAPDSPILHACEATWDFAAAEPKIEAQLVASNDYPALTLAAAHGYENAKRFEKAVVMYDRYLAVSPDFEGYKALAECYRKAGDDDGWLAAYVASLQAPAAGLEHATANVTIADFLVRRGRHAEAMTYAKDAAASGSQWGLECLVRTAEANNDFATAEQAAREAGDHYNNPLTWPLWCIRTGRGDWPAATKQLEAAERSLAEQIDRESVVGRVNALVCLGRAREAEDLAADTMARTADPYAGLFAMTLAIARGDDAVRDRMAAVFEDNSRTFVMPDGKPRTALVEVGRYLVRRSRDGKPVDPNRIKTYAKIDFRDEPNVFYFAGRYALIKGDRDTARELFKLSAASLAVKDVRSFAAAELRGLGDPAPATAPKAKP